MKSDVIFYNIYPIPQKTRLLRKITTMSPASCKLLRSNYLLIKRVHHARTSNSELT